MIRFFWILFIAIFCHAECPHIMWGKVRYTTPEGIGYKNGYTTLAGFFSQKYGKWLPFLDLRGHVFDNGFCAANAGVGVRYFTCSRLWGVQSYYDYRDSSHTHYNQWAIGFETLGKIWDFRINGYLPVGTKESAPLNVSSGIQGNQLIYQFSQDFGMKGANAEAGANVDLAISQLYFAGGPYYLTSSASTTWGGKVRARFDFFDHYFRIEGILSYDHLFQWRGQGEISISVPFGDRVHSCSEASKRSVEQVDRFEIIPETTRQFKTPAINPATGEPWSF